MKKTPLPGLPTIDLPTVNLPPAPPSDPLREAMHDIGPAAMRWFKDIYDRDIIVWADIVPRAGGGRDIVFNFRMALPGLLPTPIEKRTFNAFIAGYRSAINIALSLAEPESSTLRN